MTDESTYEDWLADRRSVAPDPGLPDRVMAALDERGSEQPSTAVAAEQSGLADRLNRSTPARIAACVARLLIGCLPFVVVAYVAQAPLF